MKKKSASEDLFTQRKETEKKILALRKEIDAMDFTIRSYLVDKKNRKYPGYKRLVRKIRNYKLGYEANTHLHSLLDSLQWKQHYHLKSWDQWFEDDEKEYLRERRKEKHYVAPEPKDAIKKKKKSIEALWEMQQIKSKDHKIEGDLEPLVEFQSRIMKEYKQLKRGEKESQAIIMYYDKRRGLCDIKLEERRYRKS
jgi:hypothetical protein